MERKITITWRDDPEFTDREHYNFMAEFFRLQQLLAQKFLKQEKDNQGYRAVMRIKQE